MNVAHVLSGYVLGELFVVLITACITTAGLLILQVPYSYVLGPLAGVCVLIPYVGVILSTTPAFVVSLLASNDAALPVKVLVFYSVVQFLVYYSESGNGVGYNYLTLRGFDQRRLSVLVNGVPQNDPEDQNVYWLDFPDLATNSQDIQVQRSAGSAFYGPPAIGGSINLVTSIFQPRPGVRVLAGGGSFDTQKYSVEMNSGLVDGTYAFYGRYSRILSDGYRRDSWVDFTSYFFGGARYDETMTTRIHIYGGPIADGLAYYGVPREALHDREARRQNPLAGGAHIENFSQPLYELLGNSVVRRVTPDGIITTFAGNGEWGTGSDGDGGPAVNAKLGSPSSFAASPDGSVYFVDSWYDQLRKVSPPMPGFTAQEFGVSSEDGSEMYVFDRFGKHLRTLDAITGSKRFEFTYDGSGLLAGVRDIDSLSTNDRA